MTAGVDRFVVIASVAKQSRSWLGLTGRASRGVLGLSPAGDSFEVDETFLAGWLTTLAPLGFWSVDSLKIFVYRR